MSITSGRCRGGGGGQGGDFVGAHSKSYLKPKTLCQIIFFEYSFLSAGIKQSEV